MTLLVLPMTIHDFDKISSQPLTLPPGCDLVANPVPTCWPVEDRAQALERAQWHFDRQRQRFLEDETALFIKVVDTDRDSDIIGIARWHFYPRGFDLERDGRWELSQLMENHDRRSLTWNWTLHDQILRTRDRERQSWISPGHGSCWVLTHLVTRPDQRGRGVASMLVRWGLQHAEACGQPACLEAGVMGLRLYTKLGFVAVGRPIVIRSDDELVNFEMAKMIWRLSR